MEVFQERLENIRRGTGLDPKTSLFVVPTQRSEAELESALDSVLSALFAQATEYYRDLGRHSRKKKGRGVAPQPTIPPTTGTSHTLSLQGWNVRYDFKAGVFAEFRQEMDVALRSYEQAYETLLGSDVLETIPSWSPGFNDGRLLADTIAIRILRCLLWTGQSTAAVRRWQAHRNRTSDFLDRRGRGTQNYGWEAWEARWADIMANLIEKVEYPELESSSETLFRQPEKTLSAERLQPWELLHHSGYWYRKAAQHALDRRKLAYTIPEDDRKPPDMSAVSKSAAKAYNSYDTYMCPEPYEELPLNSQGTDHSRLILKYFNLARVEFQKRQQLRLAAEVALECAKELEQTKAWTPLLELLAPLWRDMTFRTEEWWDITELLSWTLRRAAAAVGNADLVIAIDWELLNSSKCSQRYPSLNAFINTHAEFSRQPKWHYDISKSLDNVAVDQTPEVIIGDEQITSFLASSFVFKHDEGRAGQTCPAQLTITSNAFVGTPPVTLEEINVEFEGSVRTVHLKHDAQSENQAPTIKKKVFVTAVVLTETDVTEGLDADDQPEVKSQPTKSIILEGKDSLTLLPGQTRVFEFNLPLREAGEAQASVVSITLAPDAFRLRYRMKIRETNTVGLWYASAARKKITRVNPHTIKVLPRPPKMEIRFLNALNQYYAGEPILFDVEIINEEDVDALTKLDVHLYGQDVPSFKAQVADGPEQSSTGEGEEATLNGLAAGTIATSKSTKSSITIEPISRPTAYDLTIKAWYSLVSDPATPIVQIVAFQINIVNPFEASYDLVPRLHNDAWPSIFDHEGIHDLSDEDEHAGRALGLAQKWCLISRFGSFAAEDMRVLDLDVKVLATQGAVVCTASKNQTMLPTGLIMSPQTMEEARFDIVAHKLSLDDRSPSTADLEFIIKWQRVSSDANSAPNITSFQLDPFYVTVSEPRVLASVSYSVASPPSPSSTPTFQSKAPSLIIFDITIENPSNHFLTFGLTMEPSDEYAFSGAKATTLNVLPVARRTVTYRLLPFVTGTWIKPTLVVRDKYFQKILNMIPTEGMRREGDGIGIWVPEEVEGEDEKDVQDGGKVKEEVEME